MLRALHRFLHRMLYIENFLFINYLRFTLNSWCSYAINVYLSQCVYDGRAYHAILIRVIRAQTRTYNALIIRIMSKTTEKQQQLFFAPAFSVIVIFFGLIFIFAWLCSSIHHFTTLNKIQFTKVVLTNATCVNTFDIY